MSRMPRITLRSIEPSARGRIQKMQQVLCNPDNLNINKQPRRQRPSFVK